jgi:hypothetical protein
MRLLVANTNRVAPVPNAIRLDLDLGSAVTRNQVDFSAEVSRHNLGPACRGLRVGRLSSLRLASQQSRST